MVSIKIIPIFVVQTNKKMSNLIGCKVLCIYAGNRGGIEEFPQWLEEGRLYTIRGVQRGLQGAVGYRLKEIVLPKVYMAATGDFEEPAFISARFALALTIDLKLGGKGGIYHLEHNN